jgi:3-hydroxybutyryl-CoA dehydrogenase
MQVCTIGIIGAGTMGSGIAQVCAGAGLNVILTDVNEATVEKGLETIARNLDRLAAKNKLSAADKEAALARIESSTSYDALATTDMVIEAATENLAVKQTILEQIDRLIKPDAIVASNTSSVSITKLAAAISHPDHFIGMHFFNPVPVMKLVEVIKGLATSDETTARTIALAEAMGKTPVPANDRPGFVSNRVLMPMINEAFYAWMEGVAEPADIDEIMKLGCAHPMGPLRLADFIGLDTCVHIMEVLADGLNNPRYRACPLLKQLVVAGRLGDKSGRGVFEYPKK